MPTRNTNNPRNAPDAALAHLATAPPDGVDAALEHQRSTMLGEQRFQHGGGERRRLAEDRLSAQLHAARQVATADAA